MAGKETEGGSTVNNVRKWGMKEFRFPCFKSNRLSMPLTKSGRHIMHSFQNEKGKEVGFRVRRGRAGRDGSP